MHGGIYIGRLFGIKIFIDWSWTFIGWFLNNAAVQSYRQVVIDDVLEGIHVSRLMHRSVPTLTPVIKVSQFVDEFLMNHGGRAFPVLQGEQLVGMISVQDVRKIPRPKWDVVSVKEVMTPRSSLEVVNPEEDAAEALHILSEHDVRQVPVVEGGRLVGLLRRQDIIRWLQLQNQSMAS